MVEQYEIVEFDAAFPARLKSIYLEQMDSHWHRGIEIILVLNGEVQIICNGDSYNLTEDDIIVINENSIHSLKSKNGCNLVSLQINTDHIANSSDKYFECNSSIDNNKGKFYNLKRLIAELVKQNCTISKNNLYYNLSIVYAVYYELSKNFSAEASLARTDKKYFERLNRILNYIDQHYRENITLAQLAETEHISIPYLSSFMEKNLGINFLTYYNELRLYRATNEMLASERSIEDIALTNGFPDPRSFTKLFKKKYGVLPSVYRKQEKTKSENAQNQIVERGIQDRRINRDSNLFILSKYLPAPEQKQIAENKFISNTKVINKQNINTNTVKKNLKHTFKVFTAVARAKELLFEEVRQQLAEIQRDIGYEYIKFHGLISDDMLVYDEDATGNPKYSFVYIDKVLDFLVSINLKPMIQFSFMPKALAKDPSKRIYSSPFIISPPKDMTKWKSLITELTGHLIERYGLKVVKTWLFCVWNEPDTSTTLFGFENDLEFYELYKTTRDAVKEVNRSLVFGSPSLLVAYNINRKWLVKFIEWCKQNDCLPDYMNIHFYDNDFSDDSINTHRPAHPAHSRLNMDENSFKKCIGIVKNLFDELSIGRLPIYLTEWNLTVSHRNLLNDTCFKSCYLAKNLLENYDTLDSFGYWVLSDFMEETQPPKEQFHGGLGLFTLGGIKKPHYYTFDFMNRLGDKLIEQGDGYFITKTYNSIKMIFYNYEHFNHLFAQGESFDMTFTKRYTPFSELGKMAITLELTNIPAKSCTVKEHVLNQQSGSAFDEWVNMGAPEMDESIVNYLKKICIPKLIIHTEPIVDSNLTITSNLEPLEVRLIEINY